MASLRFIYRAGADDQHRPIVVLVVNRIPAAQFDRVLLYVVLFLDPIVNRDYTVVCVQSQTTDANKTSWSTLFGAYRTLSRKFKKNIKKLYIVHPTWWLKFVLWCSTPFVSKKVWAKVQYIDNVYTQLLPLLTREQLNLPAFVYQYDEELNGPPAL
eukprot:TRINITY_DN8491_c0_g1_i2.p1 TRINITY_DN8491_c0_g1~~TRINITY_DN8491_c0_g1_i2.p1  ORF type:complete len:156 (+),score=42.52 TRINITY_DN8491_c0_g1_i2:63-530(+)